jgi:hypothetical protein
MASSAPTNAVHAPTRRIVVAEAGADFAEHAQGDEQDRDGDDQGESATRRG